MTNPENAQALAAHALAGKSMTKTEISEVLAKWATISVLHAGEVLGLSKSAIYAAAHSGDLPTIRVGRRLLVPTEKLAAMLGLKPEVVTG